MSFNPFNSASHTSSAAVIDQGLRTHMLRVFNYMGLGVGVTGVVAYLIATNPSILQLFYTPQGSLTGLGIVAIFAPLGFVFFMSFAAMRSSLAVLQLMFWALCATMGISMASIFLLYTNQSIASTFFVSAGMFFATALYGYTTKADLSKMGSFMVMGLIGMMLAGIVNIFLHSTALAFAYSVAGVIVFTGLTAWDTQRIKETYSEGAGVENNGKLAVLSALSLYLNFINLFRILLSFMGNRRN